MTRKYDVVVWGATGFTGSLVVEYLAKNYSKTGLRYAIAGRDADKLSKLAERLELEDVDQLLGDSLDGQSMCDLTKQTKVVISTVGPFAKYGELLVAACVKNGTQYVDSTGEPQFVRKMINRHHEQATEEKTRIVHCCGYDSIPFDLGVLMVQKAFKEKFGTYAAKVKGATGKSKGGYSGGTAASLLNVFDEIGKDPRLLPQLMNPYGLNPEGVCGPDKGDQKGVWYDSDLKGWTAPFAMAAVNTRVVRRSHALMGMPWGKDFRYSEFTGTGSGFAGLSRAVTATGGLTTGLALAVVGPVRRVLQKRLLAPGEGPDQNTRENGYFETHFIACKGDQRLRGFVGNDLDPGYGSTAVMLAESALCLALQQSELPDIGGVLTPATSMGELLIQRLKAVGFRFEIVDC